MLQSLYDPFQSSANYQLSLKRKPEDTDWRQLVHNGTTVTSLAGQLLKGYGIGGIG